MTLHAITRAMFTHSPRLLTAFSLTALLVAGCSTAVMESPTALAERIVPGRSTADNTSGNTKPTTREKKLSDREAAIACLATAEELAGAGHHREAIALYERARSLDSRHTHIAHRLAVLYDVNQDHTRALAEYQKALAATPNNADLLNDFGYYHYTRGNYTEAELWFRRALEKQPNHERAQVNLGTTLFELQRIEESFAAFERALGPAAAYSNVGMLLARAGRREEAIHHLRHALAHNSQLQQAHAMLAYLERPPTATAENPFQLR